MEEEKYNPEEAPRGSLVLAIVFLIAFILFYFLNFKYLAGVKWFIG